MTPSVHASIPDPVTLMTTGRPLAKFFSNVGDTVVGDTDMIGLCVGAYVAVGRPVGHMVDGATVVE